VVTLHWRGQDSFQATYEPIEDNLIPTYGGFCENCNGHVIGGGGNWHGSGTSGGVFEFYENSFIQIFSYGKNGKTEERNLIMGRSFCSSLYIPPALENHDGILLVAGSYGGKGSTNMEYLMVNNDFRHNHWLVCEDRLPSSVDTRKIQSIRHHQMNLLQNKIILTGGWINGTTSNTVWLGKYSFNLQKLRVKWSLLPPMIQSRCGHVAVVIQDKLFCIGGMGQNTTEYFSFESKCWQKGPQLPFTLEGAKAVFNKQKNQCYLLGGLRDNENSADVSLFDPIKGITKMDWSMDIPRAYHIAVLL